MDKLIIGWREWCNFPELGLPAVKAKIDTGARTSALHAFNIEVYKLNNQDYARFYVQPLKRYDHLIKLCTAPLVGRKVVTDSGGHKELRLVIKTKLVLANQEQDIEITLTNRREMTHMLLVGRKALENYYLVDTSVAFTSGRIKKLQLKNLYEE